MSSGRTIELRLKSVHATVKQLSALIEKPGNGNSPESWRKACSKDQTCSHLATAFDALIMAQKIIIYVTDENETLITKESEYKAETHHLILNLKVNAKILAWLLREAFNISLNIVISSKMK